MEKYFRYVVEIGVSKDRRIKPEQSKYKKYYLLLCTYNDSALSRASHQKEKIKESMRGPILDLGKYCKDFEK